MERLIAWLIDADCFVHLYLYMIHIYIYIYVNVDRAERSSTFRHCIRAQGAYREAEVKARAKKGQADPEVSAVGTCRHVCGFTSFGGSHPTSLSSFTKLYWPSFKALRSRTLLPNRLVKQSANMRWPGTQKVFTLSSRAEMQMTDTSI